MGKIDKENIPEKYINVSEIRVVHAIEKYRRIKNYNNFLSISISAFVSFLCGFISSIFTDKQWMWITFLILLIVSFIFTVIFVINDLSFKKKGYGSEKWFMSILRNEPFYVEKKYHDKEKRKKIIFMIFNIVAIIAIPLTVLLCVLGHFNWSISQYYWAPFFWIMWAVGTFSYVLFGTRINSSIVFLICGYKYTNDDVF